MLKRTPLRRSALPRSGKPIAKVNVKALAKRKARLRKWYSSAEYKRQRKESLELAGHRCQYEWTVGENSDLPAGWYLCPETTGLQMHELRYRFARSTPADRRILCKAHHEAIEALFHPTRRPRRTH